MAFEDFSNYTEVDPNSRIVVATRRVAFTDLQINESAYVYKDKGAAFFDGDFAHQLTIIITASDASMSQTSFLWALGNIVSDQTGLTADTCLGLNFYSSGAGPTRALELAQYISGGSTLSSQFTLTVNTIYYLTIYRDESVGANGTLYCRIHTNADRSDSPTTISVTLTANNDFQYIYAFASRSDGNATKHSGYTENLELQDVITSLLEVSTEEESNLADTTVTGNGTIINTGVSSITAHGHAWNTLIDPLTSDNNVDNGAGSAGTFTSSITGLIAGQKYYMRAYATNSEGTVYGANVVFTTGNIGARQLKGNLGVVGTNLHYVDNDGKERYITGLLV